MSETFKYPDASAPTKTLTFTGHRIGDGETIVYNQITDHTVGGVMMVKALGDEFRRWQYTVVIPITSGSTDLADVIEFFYRHMQPALRKHSCGRIIFLLKELSA